MNSFKTLAATMALATVLGLATRGAAQTPAPAALTDETLKEMLTNLGYEPEADRGANCYTVSCLKVKRGNTTPYPVYVSLSPGKTKLWAHICLAKLNPNVPAWKVLKLLELNLKIGPAHFCYEPDLKMVYLLAPLDNRGVTPKLLKEHLEQLVENCEKTREYWDPAMQPESKPVAVPY